MFLFSVTEFLSLYHPLVTMGEMLLWVEAQVKALGQQVGNHSTGTIWHLKIVKVHIQDFSFFCFFSGGRRGWRWSSDAIIPLHRDNPKRNRENKVGGPQTQQWLVQKLDGYYERSPEGGSQESPASHTSISRNKKLWYLAQIVFRKQNFKYFWCLFALPHDCLDEENTLNLAILWTALWSSLQYLGQWISQERCSAWASYF